MRCFLIGGGLDPAGIIVSHAPFVRACGAGPIACLVLEHDHLERFESQLRSAGAGEVRAAEIAGATPELLDGVAGIYVGGGWTPGYADALAALAPAIRSAGVPYAGYSAGAAVAPATALVGGWRLAGRAVCPQEAGEDLEELTVRAGLGLVDFAVDVHASQWGTLGRLLHAVDAGLVAHGVAIDEHTCLEVEGDRWTVHGSGAVHRVRPGAFEVFTA